MRPRGKWTGHDRIRKGGRTLGKRTELFARSKYEGSMCIRTQCNCVGKRKGSESCEVR